MGNLLKDTTEAIDNSGHSPKEIIFIGTEAGQSCTWEEFEVLANVKYDSGYGAAQILGDLVIVFSDNTHLARAEYDGSEWWEYITPVKIPESTVPLDSVFFPPYTDE